jgi:hypothetical protein
VSLTGVSLTGVSLTGVSLTGVSLTGVHLIYVYACFSHGLSHGPASPIDYYLIGVFLIDAIS